ncbi:Transcription initiation factor IIA subunit 2 [Yarrowia sp. B02]|nr:Transcription initiation factor IIA subunit 2 [Yarrowia sp. B02]
MSAPYYNIYRVSSIGTALTEALDELIRDSTIPPQLALKVVEVFDRVMADTLRSEVRNRMSFKGELHTYRGLEDVWTFIIRRVVFKMDNNDVVNADKIKIVTCNARKAGDA